MLPAVAFWGEACVLSAGFHGEDAVSRAVHVLGPANAALCRQSPIFHLLHRRLPFGGRALAYDGSRPCRALAAYSPHRGTGTGKAQAFPVPV